jgi:hypothetical protein
MRVAWPPAPGAEAEGMIARAFGTRAADLDVDFAAPLGAAMTALLAACLGDAAGAPVPAAEIARWTVKRRRQGLLAVDVATGGPERTMTARCPHEGCGAVMELGLDLDRFRADWRTEDIAVGVGGDVVRLRPPRPDDLHAWAAARDAAPEALAARLVVGPPPPADWGAAAEAALAEDDGLAGLELDTACPDCGRPVRVPLALESFLMADLARSAAARLDEVHVIAGAYHWPEADILALPAARRRHYLARIAEARA